MERIEYSPLPTRPPLGWPGGARIALWVVPNIEHYEYMPPQGQMRDPWPRMPHPDILNYGLRDYGNRAGLWRMLDVFDKHGVRATMSLNLAVYEHYPQIMDACEGRGYDLLCHGLYNTRYLWGLPEYEERAIIADCVATWKRLTGRMIPGWFSPVGSYTVNTPDLVAEAGIPYYSDWNHDDQPTPLRTRSGKTLISVPYQMDINDAMTSRTPIDGEEFARLTMDHFDCLYRESAFHGRVMCIALHPYIMGLPHRIGHLDRALRHILGHEGVWMATGKEIADWYAAHALGPMEEHLTAEAPLRVPADRRAKP
jgi:peptidoglycan/xylan/chitin deacetylase (PgdA/CDA1 family)